MSEERMQVRLGDIVMDPTVAVRKDIPRDVVARYASSMKQGDIFPPITVEKDTLRLICGTTRVIAARQVFDPDHTMSAIVKTFSSDIEARVFAAEDNRTHGQQLTNYDRRILLLRFKKDGVGIDIICRVLGIDPEKVKEWSAKVIFTRDPLTPDEVTEIPSKKGFEHLEGKEVKPSVLENIKDHGLGLPVTFIARQILMRLNDDTIKKGDEEQNTLLVDLYKALGKFLQREKCSLE